jgi:hypothetical protein
MDESEHQMADFHVRSANIPKQQSTTNVGFLGEARSKLQEELSKRTGKTDSKAE